MNTSVLLQSKCSPKGFTLTLQKTRSIHDSMNFTKIEFITYINIFYFITSSEFNAYQMWVKLVFFYSEKNIVFFH